jgi:hypothetical protein
MVMGFVHAEIELVNADDIRLLRKHEIDEGKIRRIIVTALVDPDYYCLVINEKIQEYLQLDVVDRRKMEVAKGFWLECDIVGPIELRFKNRCEFISARVVPGGSEVIFGNIVMGALDVMIDTTKQQLIVNPAHPDFAVHRI